MDGLDLELPELDLETPEVETPEVETSEVEEEPSEVETPAEETPEAEEQPADGRRVPDEVRKALKAFRDSSPENAKAARALNDAYGREQAYKAIYPTVKDAQNAQSTIQTIESLGGLDGIQSTVAEIEEVDAMLQAGDPRAVDKIFEVAGEGAGKIVPAMLDKLQAANPEVYAAAIRPHLVKAVAESGLADAFDAVLQRIDLAGTPGASPEFKAKFEGQAKEGLAKIAQYLKDLGKPQQSQTTSTQPDAKLQEREQQLASREAAAFNNDVSAKANPRINAALSKAITPYVGKFSKEQRADFTQSVYDEVAKLVKANKDYQRNKDAAFKSRTKDAGKIANLMAAEFERVVADAAKAVNNRRYGKTSPAGTAQSGAKGQQGVVKGAGSVEKPILVKELPPRSDVDFEKTTDDLMIRGIRVLKSGKVVRLDR